MRTVAKLIRTHAPEILRAWSEAAKQATSAKNLSAPELASFMPDYLALLGDDGAGMSARLSSEQTTLIERHLSNRLREGFSLNEILTEVAILGRSVSPFLLASSTGDRASAAEVASFYTELYQTSIAVTRIFNEHLLEDEQTMKRYGRLLELIADEPLGFQHRSASLLERLNEVLALILEAMGARAAALLVFEGRSEQATTSAAVGAGHAELDRLAHSLEATAYVGTAGAAGVEAGEVPPTPTLREIGVHSLLRVRLAVHDARRCVLYVGIEVERPFTASEVRRLEGLSRLLTIHLDNARLRGNLRRAIDELGAERELRERIVSVLIREVRGPLSAARSRALHLRTNPIGVPAQASEIVETLGSVERVVDDFLATTPAMPAEGSR